jgi:hypothetical protein
MPPAQALLRYSDFGTVMVIGGNVSRKEGRKQGGATGLESRDEFKDTKKLELLIPLRGQQNMCNFLVPSWFMNLL